MAESAAARKAREAAEAEAAEQAAVDPEAQESDESAPQAETGEQPSDELSGPQDAQEPPEQRWYVVTSPLPRPGGGAYRIGDRFLATEDDPRVKSHFSRLAPPDDDEPPAAVADALDAPGE